MALEDVIKEGMLQGGVQALNVFRNPDGVFQANIGFRDRGPAKVVHAACPAKALAEAFKVAKARQKAVTVADQFEDLLG